jgi:hypothetical protein
MEVSFNPKRGPSIEEFRQRRLLEELDACGLTRLMDHYAEEEDLKKHYHEKAKRERAEARRLKREQAKAKKKSSK